MPKLSISQAWDETRAILARDGRLFVSVALALIVLPQTVLGAAGLPQPNDTSGLSAALMFVVLPIGLTGQIALSRLAMTPPVTVAAGIGRGFKRLPILVGALILVGLALMIVLTVVIFVLGLLHLVTIPAPGQTPPVGLVLILVVCSVFVAAVVQLIVPVSAAEDGGPVKLLSRSWALSRHNYLRLLGFVIIVLVAAIATVIAGQVVIGSVILVTLGRPVPWSIAALLYGLLVALIQAAVTVVASVMLARIYVQRAGSQQAHASVPSSGI